MRRLINLLFLFLIISGCDLIEDIIKQDEPDLNSAEFYETGDASYPVIAIDETQTIFGFSQYMDELFVQLPEGDKWVIKVGDNNFPSSMYVEKGSLNLLLLFSDFNGNKSNVAVINQNTGTTEYFYDIEFGNISEATAFDLSAQIFDLKSANCTEEISGIVEWWNTYGEAVKKMAGPVIGGIGCGMSAITALGSGGVATPIAVLSCGSWVSSITGDIVGESSDAGGALFKGGSVVGKYGEMVLKCAYTDWGGCAMGIAGEIGAIVNLIKYGTSRPNANEAKEHLTAYAKTGGLAGSWVGEEYSVAGNTIVDQYFFGLHAGEYIQINQQSQDMYNITTETKIGFNYSVNNDKLNLNLVRVSIASNGTINGETYSETFGPYSWSEFVNLGDASVPGFNTETIEHKFTIKENGNKLELSNGSVYHRVNE